MKKLTLMIVVVLGFLSSCKKENENNIVPNNKTVSNTLIGNWYARYIGNSTYIPNSNSPMNDTLYHQLRPYKTKVNYSFYNDSSFKWKRTIWFENNIEENDSVTGKYFIFNDTLQLKYPTYYNKYLFTITNDSLLMQSLYDSTLADFQIYKKY